MQAQFLDLSGIKTWLPVNDLPLTTSRLYLNVKCLAILPIEEETMLKFLPEINQLMLKMLLVLALEDYELTNFMLKLRKDLAEQELTALKVKLMAKFLVLQPQTIVNFGNDSYLDHKLLAEHKILVFNIMHPAYLLQHPEHKTIVHKDLLACRRRLNQIL